MTEKLTWRLSEVIAFLESKLQDNTATEDETLMYENYVWNNKINRVVYKSLVVQMREEYLG
ncbi:hypothetical protein D3C84_1277830 [compost metagenome]